MNALTSIVASAPADDPGRLLVWIAVPAAIFGALVAGAIKRAILSNPRFRGHRPGIRIFFWIGLADLIVWAILWPSLLAVRLHSGTSNRALWILALLMVIALGYIANRYGFGKALDPAVAGSLRGTLLAELFTVLMPIISVIAGIMVLVVLGFGE
jgi:hypothetical protein